MQTYAIFYRQHGMRNVSQLLRPPLSDLETLRLPVNSAYHYVTTDEEDDGVSPDDQLLNGYANNIVVDHVVDMPIQGLRGEPHSRTFNDASYVQEFHRRYKNFKRLASNAQAVRNQRMLYVVNYAPLAKHYRYLPMGHAAIMQYDRWANAMSAVWIKAAEIAKDTGRQQFIRVDLPVRLPSIAQLNMVKDHSKNNVIQMLHGESSYFLSDMWQWLGEERSQSTLARIPSEAVEYMNLVWLVGGKWATLNLGLLERMRKTPDNKQGVATPEQLQRLYLRMNMSLQESVTVVTEDASVTEAAPAADKDSNPSPAKTLDEVMKAADKLPENEVDKEDTSQLLGEDSLDTAEVLQQVDKDLDAIPDEEAAPEEEEGVYPGYVAKEVTIDNAVEAKAMSLVKKGLLSAGEHGRLVAISQRYKSLPNPYGDGKLADLLEIKPEELQVPETAEMIGPVTGVLDNSMRSCSLQHFDERYIENILPKDIVSTVMSVQRAGIAVQDYNIRRVDTMQDSYEIHTVRLVPAIGKPSTISFRLPVVKPDGTYLTGGTIYRLRKQRGDSPIRKTAPDEVSLTSYFSKMFVRKTERVAFSYDQWLCNQIIKISLIGNQEGALSDIKFANCFTKDHAVPPAYAAIAQRIRSFVVAGYTFNFDYKAGQDFFGAQVVKDVLLASKGELIPVAKGTEGVLVMDFDNELYHISHLGNLDEKRAMGQLDTFLGLPSEKRPTDYVEVGVFGKDIPVGILLAMQAGLGNLLKTLKARHRRVLVGERETLGPTEYVVRFQDEKLILDRRDAVATLLMQGFNRYHNEIKRYSIYHFDKPEVYANILNDVDIRARHLRKIDLMFNLWVDPITRGLLVEMDEPLTLFELFISATKKLTLNTCPDPMDMEHMRIKGYERFAGILYDQLMRSLTDYSMKASTANAMVDMHPYAVWSAISEDETKMPVKDANPIHALKEQEVVVYSGHGGRSSRSMTAPSRKYHKNAMGVISEATVDSGEVATITYLTADPNFNSLRGTTRRVKDPVKDPAKMLSTSVMLAPAVDRDDPKRANFCNIQNSATTHAVGYTPLPTRTGYERVIAQRSSRLFSQAAKEDGKIVSIQNDVMMIQYASGAVDSFPMGRQYGKWDGEDVPHQLDTVFKVGDEFKKSDILLYNSMYYTPDIMNPKNVLLKFGVLAYTVFCEVQTVFEDSCALSESFAEKMATTITRVREVSVDFDKEVRNLVKVGETLTTESILCTIHHASGGNSDIFSDEALSTLMSLSQTSPKAKYPGKVERIEVVYCGDTEDMSPSLKTLAEQSDTKMRRTNKELRRAVGEANLERGTRVSGKPIDDKQAVIKIYITGPNPMGVADKCVFANQMKGTVGEVFTGVLETDEGVSLDAKFSYRSFDKRIVNSGDVIGTTSTLAVEIGKRMIAAYRG